MIYAIMSQKGGVGKTTAAVNIAFGLADKKKKVLLVDADQQENAWAALGGQELPASLVEVFRGEAKAAAAVLPGKVDLAAVSAEIVGYDVKPGDFKKALSGLRYDYIIIDCPPGLSDTTKAALLCADRVILPITSDLFGLQALKQSKGIIDGAKQINKGLKVSGLLRMRYVERLNITETLKKNIEEAGKAYGVKGYKTAVRECVAVRECNLFGKSIYDYAPNSTAAADFRELVKEIMKER